MKNSERYAHMIRSLVSFFKERKFDFLIDCPGIGYADFKIDNGEPGEIKHAGELNESQYKRDWTYWNKDGRCISTCFTRGCVAGVATKGFLATIVGQLRSHVLRSGGNAGWLALEIAPFWYDSLDVAIAIAKEATVITEASSYECTAWVKLVRFVYANEDGIGGRQVNC